MLACGWCLSACGPGVSRYLDELRIDRLPTPAAAPGTALSYLRAAAADERRLIFVHGTPESADNYLSYLVDPPAGWEVISVDRPGFGSSPAGDAASLTLAGQAAALVPLLVERDGKRPVLVGHSLGGPIVLRLAADRPDAVGGVVVLAGSVDPALERPRWYNVAGAVPPIPWLLPAALRRANEEIFAAPRETQALAKVLGRVVCPVVIGKASGTPWCPRRTRITCSTPCRTPSGWS